MRTSRIAKDTAAVMEALSPRRTRSALLSSSAGASPATSLRTARRSALKSRPNGSISPSPSLSRSAYGGPEIEDAPLNGVDASSRKRKRAGTGGASATGTPGSGTPGTPSRRSNRRVVPIKQEEEESADSDLALNAGAAANDASESDRDNPTSSPSTALRPPKSQPMRTVKDKETGQVTIHPPSRWLLQWDACQAMRARILAPVDTVGCDRLHDAGAPAADQRFQTLVALMLSPQTKDGVTAAAMERIRAALGPGHFTVAGILATDEDALDALINPVGFHRTKARHIRAASALLQERHASDVPRTPAALMALPGVGPKIAYLCLAAAWGETLGIGVDTHVHRITNRWGWHRTNNAEETRKALEQWLPRDRWAAVNHMLVGFGQTVCAPIGPRCNECALAEQRVCPAAVRGKQKARSVLLSYKKEEALDGKELKQVEEGVVKRLDGQALRVIKVEKKDPI